MKRGSDRKRRWVVLAQVAVVVGGALGTAAAPASAVPGLHKVTSEEPAPPNSDSPKLAVAYCPANQRVIGGGGSIKTTAGSRKPALTELRPVRHYDGGSRDAYVVRAAETGPGTAGSWSVKAYAMCANPIAGMGIVRSVPAPLSSSPVQARPAVCPSGQRALGSGGAVSSSTTTGEVVLQVARPSRPGDITRVQAHEDANGYAGFWTVTAYAICAPPPPGYQVVFWQSREFQSERTKTAGLAEDRCPGATRLHSSGAAVASDAPGSVSLQRIFPDTAARRTKAVAVENMPTPADWKFIVASGVCAS